MEERVIQLIDAAVEALVLADLPALLRLAEAATKARRPVTRAERAMALQKMRLFREVLTRTRRNLRLLGAAYGRCESYEQN